MKEMNIQFSKNGYNSDFDVYCSQYHAKKSEKGKYFDEMEMTMSGIIIKTYKWEIYQIAINENLYWKKQKKLIRIKNHSEPS